MSTAKQPTHWQKIARRIRVPLGFLFAGFYFWIARPSLHSLAASLLLVLPGLALRAMASGHVKKNSELTTSGPYAFTRNPLYSGSMLIAFGFALASRSWTIAIALVVLFAIIYVPTILSEEAFLRERFTEFDAYTQQVPRLLPYRWPRKNKSVARGSFSWELYRAHNEYNASLGALLLYFALIVRMVLHR